MKKFSLLLALLMSLALAGTAQKQKDAKPWTEWTKDDVTRMLDKSPWGRAITNTDTSEMTVTMGVSDPNQGARNQAISWNYHIRFFSAKPVREAFARKVTLDNPAIKPEQLQRFIDGDYSESIVVAVAYDATDRRYLAEREKAFNNATAEQLASTVYLELKNGNRIPLVEYAPPSKDGTGAKFVFPRLKDGTPYITDDKEVIHLVIDMGNGIGFDYRFKLADMTYNGKLEY
jgi:hypothetical protein